MLLTVATYQSGLEQNLAQLARNLDQLESAKE